MKKSKRWLKPMSHHESMYFNKEVYHFVRSAFDYLSVDYFGNKRLFFENSGGALRLTSASEKEMEIAKIPDCPERKHQVAKFLDQIILQGKSDVRDFLNAHRGEIIMADTASKVMFNMIGTITANTRRGNIVTTSIEHPSSFDACKMFAQQTGQELRVAKANPKTGGVDVEEIIRLIDEDTTLLSVIWTSNITGTVLDVKEVVEQVRAINENIYIVVDAVQTAPHRVIDIEATGVDGLNIAPYKMFGNRGIAFGYVSDRVSTMPHHRLLATEENNWDLGSSTPSFFAGFTEIINYICRIGRFFTESNNRREQIVSGMEAILKQEHALMQRLLEGLSYVDHIKVHFTDIDISQKDFIVAISFDHLSETEATSEYLKHDIVVYDRVDSNFYSKRILNSLNLKGIVRISPLHCHSIEEIDYFVEVTKTIALNN